jgi:thiol:disulfide interchange protein DsbD
MGVFSALVIGPCVTAPLAGALLYISQTGDARIGGLALFCLGLGMGVPLLAAGTFAGRYLPKAGRWMEAVKTLFGIGLLAVAIGLLGRILDPQTITALWLLLASLPVFLLLRKRRWRLAGTLTLCYAVLLWLGFSGRYTDKIPAAVCSVVEACEAQLGPRLPFKRIGNLAELDRELSATAKANKLAMLDFYADWCTACVEMEQSTFSRPEVRQALADTALFQVDVTENSEEQRAILRHLNVIGPPAVLFFNPGQKSPNPKRIIGYADAEAFLRTLNGQPLAAGH